MSFDPSMQQQNPYGQQPAQYGQQPQQNPYGQQYQGPYGQQQNPSAQPQYGQIPGGGFPGGGFPSPPKRGFPAWAWWVIGGGVLVIVAIVVVIALMVSSSTAGGTSQGSSSQKDASGSDGEPAPSKVISLQDDHEFGDDVELTLDLPKGWSESDDRDGEWVHDDTGCTASVDFENVYDTLGIEGDDDEEATQASVDSFVDALAEQDDDAEVIDDRTAVVLTDDGSKVEFALAEIRMSLYSDRESTLLLGARASVEDERVFAFGLFCTEDVDANDAHEAFEEVLASVRFTGGLKE